MVEVGRAASEDAEACVGVLASLPTHFTPDTHDDVRRGVADDAAWVARDGEEIVGFLVTEQRYRGAAEITIAAVVPDRQGGGVGTALVDAALSELAAAGVVLVEVKTLDATAGYEPYVGTRAFWERRGFHQIDCIDPLPGWQQGNPAAVFVAALSATR